LSRYTAVFCLVLLLGCTPISKIKHTAKKMVHQVKTGSAGALKKQIGIVPFVNATFFNQQDFAGILQKQVIETLSTSCSGLRLIESFPPEFDEIFNALSKSTRENVDNITIAESGRLLGLNALVFGGLTHISEKSKKEGLLWFKDTVSYAQFGFMIEVYDTETGSKLVDKSFVHEFEIDEVSAQNIRAQKAADLPELFDVIDKIGMEMAYSACESIHGVPWKGFIIDMAGERIILSSGEDAGLKIGQTLDVYTRGDMIEGKTGQRFFLPGAKSGKIEIVAVAPNRAEAVLLFGDVGAIGASVRMN
jgi:hypothetical protein